MIFIDVEGKMKSCADIFNLRLVTPGMDVEGTVSGVTRLFLYHCTGRLHKHTVRGENEVEEPSEQKDWCKAWGL